MKNRILNPVYKTLNFTNGPIKIAENPIITLSWNYTEIKVENVVKVGKVKNEYTYVASNLITKNKMIQN